MLKFTPVFALALLLSMVFWYNFKSTDEMVQASFFELGRESSDKSVLVSLSDFPVQVEQQTDVVIHFDDALERDRVTVVKAWIEGVNMYMGRITVNWEPAPAGIDNTGGNDRTADNDESGESDESNSMQRGWFFLGSCSEPKMQWRFYVLLREKGGEKDQAVRHDPMNIIGI